MGKRKNTALYFGSLTTKSFAIIPTIFYLNFKDYKLAGSVLEPV